MHYNHQLHYICHSGYIGNMGNYQGLLAAAEKRANEYGIQIREYTTAGEPGKFFQMVQELGKQKPAGAHLPQQWSWATEPLIPRCTRCMKLITPDERTCQNGEWIHHPDHCLPTTAALRCRGTCGKITEHAVSADRLITTCTICGQSITNKERLERQKLAPVFDYEPVFNANTNHIITGVTGT